MFPRLVETLVTVGRACKRGTADRQIVPATDANAPCFLVHGEETDVAAGRTKAAGVMADVDYLEDERECPAKIGGAVTEGDALAPTIGGVFIQMEDEIASICSVIGASWAGLKAMTATSGSRRAAAPAAT